MTTAIHQKPPAKAAVPKPQPAKIILQGPVKIELIDLFGNVRKEFDAAKDKELAQSIAAKGVISPLLLRPHPKISNRFLLIAGHRRLNAAKAAGLEVVPAIVREADDEQALILQIEENIQRKDLGPIEEARGFHLLTRAGKDGAPAKYTVDQLAGLVDKSTSYVYQAMALLELPKRAQEEILTGRITPAHGHQILRVPPFEREALVKDLLDGGYDGHVMTAVALREHVESQLGSRLDTAKFPKDKTYAGMDACTGCPSNTGNQGMLFAGAEKGQCMNRQCFETKTKQHKADFLEKTTLANLGAKFVEYSRGGIYPGMMRSGGYIVKEMFKKAPAKGDWGLLIEPNSQDIYLLTAKPAERPVPGSDRDIPGPGSTLAPKAADPKDAFITEKIEKALMTAAGKEALKVKVTREDWGHLADTARNDIQGIAAAILGIEEDDVITCDLNKATEAQLRAIVIANARLPYSIQDVDFKKLGVDVAAVKKSARKEAEKQWTDQVEAEKQALLKKHNAPAAKR